MISLYDAVTLLFITSFTSAHSLAVSTHTNLFLIFLLATNTGIQNCLGTRQLYYQVKASRELKKRCRRSIRREESTATFAPRGHSKYIVLVAFLVRQHFRGLEGNTTKADSSRLQRAGKYNEYLRELERGEHCVRRPASTHRVNSRLGTVLSQPLLPSAPVARLRRRRPS